MYDIIIVGGSLAGSLTALSLNKKNPFLKICIIDSEPANTPIMDNRATALSPSSIKLLTELEIWERELKPYSAPIRHIHIGMTSSNIDLTFTEARSPLGYNVQNTILKSALKIQMSTNNSTTVKNRSVVKDILIQNSYGEVVLENNTTFKGRLIIGADGRNSKIRSLLSTTETIPYKQTALTGTVSHSAPHNNQAFEFFLPQGPLAFIPLPNLNTSTLVWSLKNNLLPSKKAEIEKILCNLARPYLGEIIFTSTIERYPLTTFVAKQIAGHRWVLVGDAANAIHPVAGQGLNLAIRDITHLAQHVYKQQCLGLDIGSQTHLIDYATSRQKDRYSLIGITHLAATQMTSPSKLISHFIRRGLKWGNNKKGITNYLIHVAQFGI
ncbi:MAG: FAD-dependent monooxygenase [Candidatus Paracaedibacteraceae bacterium]|nr:FAD-dependent monooxygenase [Candidatus Paracaedibacteraceae bacterium]